MKRRLVPALAAVVVACGGSGSSGPTAPPPADLRGIYEVQHRLTLAPTGQEFATCDGDLEIDTHSGSAFSGKVGISDSDCAGAAGEGTVHGSIDGSSVEFVIEGVPIVELLSSIGCELNDASGFSGTATAKQIDATQTLDLTCPDPDTGNPLQVLVAWRLVADRIDS